MMESPYFAVYQDAFDAAQAMANSAGVDWGLEKWSSPLTPDKKFRIFRLPGAGSRYGFELRCEVVKCLSAPAEVL